MAIWCGGWRALSQQVSNCHQHRGLFCILSAACTLACWQPQLQLLTGRSHFISPGEYRSLSAYQTRINIKFEYQIPCASYQRRPLKLALLFIPLPFGANQFREQTKWARCAEFSLWWLVVCSCKVPFLAAGETFDASSPFSAHDDVSCLRSQIILRCGGGCISVSTQF